RSIVASWASRRGQIGLTGAPCPGGGPGGLFICAEATPPNESAPSRAAQAMIRLMQGAVNVLIYLLDYPVTGGREISRHRAIGHSCRVRQRRVVSAAAVWQIRRSRRRRRQRWQVI